MTHRDPEHIIRAAGTLADVTDLIVIGSQAILGQFPDAPPECLVSNQAEVFPQNNPERSELIDSTIGEGSPFQNTFGYYTHGVGPETAFLPEGWRDRLMLISGENTRFVRGWCLEVHDLAVAKYIAGRDKDLAFTAALIAHQMVDEETLIDRLRATDVDDQRRTPAQQRIARQHKTAF